MYSVVGASTTNIQVRNLVITSDGVLHIIETNNLGLSYFTSIDDGATWTEEVMNTGAVGFCPTIAVDSNDNLHIAWYQDVAGVTQIHYRKYIYSTDTWNAIEVISAAATNQYRPSVAIDSTNNPHVAWVGGTPTRAQRQVRYSYYNGAAWSAVADLTDIAYHQEYLEITINDSDVVHIVWSGVTAASSPNYEIQHIRKTGAVWSAIIYTGYRYTQHMYPSIVVDERNHLFLTFYGGTSADLIIGMFNGTSWTMKSVYPSAILDSAVPRISCDYKGNLFIFWVYAGTGEDHIRYAEYSQDKWREPVSLVVSQGEKVLPAVWTNPNIGGPARELGKAFTYLSATSEMSCFTGDAMFDHSTERLVRFVDYDHSVTGGGSGSVLLDINDGTNYCIDEIEFPPPEPRIEYVDSAHLDGREMSRYKWENREITIRMQIFGTSEDDLSANIVAVWEQLLSTKPVLEWKPSGWDEAIYFDLVNPPTGINPEDWFVTWMREYKLGLHFLSNLEITIEAQPLARGREGQFIGSYGLGINDDFETWSAGPVLSEWVVTTVGGGAVSRNAANQLTGTYCVQLDTAGGANDSAAITDKHYLPIDETLFYNLQLATLRLSGTTGFTITVECFDDDFVSLGGRTILPSQNIQNVYTDPIIYAGYYGVIGPDGSVAAIDLYPGTCWIKRTFKNEKQLASSMVIDQAFFTRSPHFSRRFTNATSQPVDNTQYRFETPGMLTIPKDTFKGDELTPARLFVRPSNRVDTPTHLIAGISHGVELYVNVMKSTSGVATSQMGCIDHRFFTNGGGATEWASVWFYLGDRVRWYYPLIRVYNATVGADDDVSMELQTSFGNITDSCTYYLNAPHTAKWQLSGIYNEADFYATPLEPIPIPNGTIPDGFNIQDGQYRFFIDVMNPTRIDYVALIPIDNGFVRGIMGTGSNSVGCYITDKLYTLSSEIALPMSEDVSNWVGQLPFYLSPRETNNLMFLATKGNVDSNVYTNPYTYLDIYLYYDPRYLLVPEE